MNTYKSKKAASGAGVWSGGAPAAVAFMLVACAALFLCLRLTALNNYSRQLQDASAQFGALIEQRTADSSQLLFSLSESVSFVRGEEAPPEESLARLERLRSISGFAQAGVCYPDGVCWFSDGSSAGAGQFSFFSDGFLSSAACVGDLFPLSQERSLVCYVPVADIEGSVLYFIFCTLDSSALPDSAASGFVDGGACVVLTDSLGDLAVRSGRDCELFSRDNVWNTLSNAKFGIGDSISAVKQLVSSGTPGSFHCTYNGQRYLAVCSLSPLDGCRVFAALPESAAMGGVYVLTLMAAAVIALLGLVFVLIGAKDRRGLMHSRYQLLRVAQRLKISDQRFRVSSSLLGSIIFEYDHNSDAIVFVSEATARLYGFTDVTTDVPGCFFKDGLVKEDYRDAVADVFARIKKGAQTASCEVLCSLTDGTEAWHILELTNIFDDKDRPVRAIGIARDITEYKRLIAQSKQSERYKDVALSDTETALEIDFTADRFLSGWDSFGLPGFGGDDVSVYKVLHMLAIDYIHPEDRISFIRAFAPTAVCSGFADGCEEVKLRFRLRRDKSSEQWRWQDAMFRLYADDSSGNIVGVGFLKDVNELVEEELQLRQQATSDPLTGLLNRATISAQVNSIIEKEPNRFHALLIIDLDGFKSINDSFGHQEGDRLLCDMAGKMRSVVPESGLIGRLGGDEFLVFLPNVNSVKFVSQVSCAICGRIYLHGDPGRHFVTCSLGASMAPFHGGSFNELYLQADNALYYAKQRGKNRCAMYRPSLGSRPDSSAPTGGGDKPQPIAKQA